MSYLSYSSKFQMIEATVLQISRCRSKDFISLIDIRVTFDSALMGVQSSNDDYCNSTGDDHSSDFQSFQYLVGNNPVRAAEENKLDDPLCNKIEEEERYESVKDHDCNNYSINENEDDGESDDCQDPYYEPQSVITQSELTVENIKYPKTREDFRFLHYPTIRLKTIKRALSLCGHTIVGDGGAVKSAKGIFAAVVKVTIFDPDYCEEYQSNPNLNEVSSEAFSGRNSTVRVRNVPITIAVEDPKKFQKLLLKEQELWELAQGRDQVLISAWNQMNKPKTAVVDGIKGAIKGLSVHGDSVENVLPVDDSLRSLADSPEGSHFCGDSSSSNDDQKSRKNKSESSMTPFLSLKNMRDALSSGMPVEYVLGEAMFCGLKFDVDSNVMVPRKSSEVLVYQATSIISNIYPVEPLGFLESNTADQGSHSGIDALSVVSNSGSGSGSGPSSDDISKPIWEGQRLRILDIGTGSGCLLLSCLKKCSERQHSEHVSIPTLQFDITGVGIDISPEALTVAVANASKLGLESKAIFRVLDFANLSTLVPSFLPVDLALPDSSFSTVNVGDIELKTADRSVERSEKENSEEVIDYKNINSCSGEHSSLYCGPYNIILCNPPYSSRRDRGRLSIACREHEPSLALFSPLGPLAAYRTLATSLLQAEEKHQLNRLYEKQHKSLFGGSIPPGLLAVNAHIVLEVGHGQDIPVKKIFSKLPFLVLVRGVKDHKGIDRCLVYRYLGD